MNGALQRICVQTTGTVLCSLCSEVLQIAASSSPVWLESLKRSEGHIEAEIDACRKRGTTHPVQSLI